MPVVNEPQNLGDLLKYEEDARYSREQVTIAANQTLVLGAVVGRNRSNGQIAVFNPANRDGTHIPIGIMAESVNTTTTLAEAVMIARHVLVARQALIWRTGITAAQQASAIDQLEERGIVVREGA